MLQYTYEYKLLRLEAVKQETRISKKWSLPTEFELFNLPRVIYVVFVQK